MLVLQIVSDALIALAYFSIPVLLIYFVKKRNDIPFGYVFAMFGAFIVLCGTTHLLGIWTIWHADFWLDGTVKALTATVSIATAIMLVPLVPKALSLKSPTALRELNERLQTGYRRIIETANEGVWMFDSDARTTYVNHRMAMMLGYDEAEMLGRPLHEFTTVPVIGGSFALSVPSAGSTDVDEIRLRHRNGSEIFGLVSSSMISDEKLGSSVLAMVTDITERKLSERRLVESEARLRALAAAVPQIIWTTTADGQVEYTNERWFAYTGVDESQTLGSAWGAVVHPDDLSVTVEAWQHSVATGSDFEEQYRYRAADGTFRWFLARAVAVRDERGNIERWFGTSTDIEMQKRAAASLQFLADASSLLASSSEIVDTLDELARLAVPTIAEQCFIFLLEDGILSCDAPGNETDRDALRPLAEEVCRTGHPIVRPVGEPLGSTIVVPLESRGESFGAIAFVERRAERLVGDSGLQLAEVISKRTATAIESARLYERERRTAKHLRYIADAGKRLSTSLDLQATLDALCELAVPELADVAIVSLCTADGPPYVAALAFADPEFALVANELRGQVFLQQLVPKYMLPKFLNGQPQIVREVDDDFLKNFVVEAMFPVAHRFGFGASLVRLPLVSEGMLLGSLSLFVTRDKLEREYTDFDIPFLQELAQRGALAIKNAQHYGREHRVADILQKASLPVSLPAVPGIRFDSVYEPGKSEAHIGGDWYDAVRLADGRVVISIGDVAGSGLEAAVTMGNLRHVLRGVAQIDADPITILDAADKTLRAEHDRMVTAFVGVLDPVTLTLTYASAGHPPPYLRMADGTIRQLPCSGLPLGLRERNEEPARSIELERGSLLVLYTDGLTESTRDIEAGERLVERALGALVFDGEIAAARAIHDAVLGSGMPGDDVAILTIEILGPMLPQPIEQRIWQWSLTSSNAEAMITARHEIFATLEMGGLLAKDCRVAELVMGELLGNVMRHAPGKADVILDWSGSAPVLNILDSGAGFEYSARLPVDILSESGRGLFLVSALTETFHVSKRRVGGSHARAVLAVGRGRS